MDELTHIFAANGGYLTRGQLIDLGYSDSLIRAMLREGVLHRLRHGAYAPKPVWDRLSTSDRHRLLARSLLDKLGPGVAASHHTAAALHGFDLYGADLDAIHIVRLDGRPGRREAGVSHHHGTITDDDLVEVDGLLVVKPARAVFDTCTVSSTESGMVVASSALHLGAVEKAELVQEGERHTHWLGGRTARLAISLADGRLESVGETRSLHMMWRHGVPYPELQWKVIDDEGRVVARTDFAWIFARHVGEFDGLFKYGRLNPHAADPGIVLAEEKRREDEVRDLRHGVSRWVWNDIDEKNQARTAARIVRAIEQSRRTFGRNATHIV